MTSSSSAARAVDADSRSAATAARAASASARAASRSTRAASASRAGTLHLGPRRIRVRASTLHLGPRRIGIVAKPLPHHLERSLELLGPLALAAQRAIEVGRLGRKSRFGVSVVAIAGGEAAFELSQPGLGRLELQREVVVGGQRGVALGHGGRPLGPGLGDCGLLLAIGRAGRRLGS